MMKAAKATAATAGESLKTLFERAIAREVGRSTAGPQVEVEYPLIRSERVGFSLGSEELDEILSADEAEHYTT